MAVNKFQEVVKGFMEIGQHILSEIDRRKESGDLAHADVAIIAEKKAFKEKHPIPYKVIVFGKMVAKIMVKLYKILIEHNWIQAIV